MSFEPRTKAYWTDGIDDPRSLVGRTKLNELILGFHPSKKTKVELRHIVVWNFHLRRAHKDYAWTSLASERFMVADLRGAFDGRWGLARQHIRKAHNELVEWKFLALAHKGGGKGDGSRYWPNFDLLSQAAAGRFPHGISITVPPEVVARYGYLQPKMATGNYGVPGSELGTTVFPVVGTTVFPVNGPTGNYGVPKDPTIQTGLKDPALYSNEEVPADTAAPGPSAAPDVAGFERCWRAYEKHGNKVAAKAAFAAIENPDVDHISKRAASWAASAKPGQKRMPFEKWLAAEKYDEADRLTGTPAAAKAKPAGKQKAKPAAKNKREAKPAATPAKPKRGGIYTIERAEIKQEMSNKKLVLYMRGADGLMRPRTMWIEHRIEREQDNGQAELQRLLFATNIGEIDDEQVFVGHKVFITADNQLRSVPANDDSQDKAA